MKLSGSVNGVWVYDRHRRRKVLAAIDGKRFATKEVFSGAM